MHQYEMRKSSTASHLCRRQWQQRGCNQATTSTPSSRQQSVNKRYSKSSWRILSSTLSTSSFIIVLVVLFLGLFPSSCYGGASSTGKPSVEKVFTNGWAIKVVGDHHQERVKRIAQKYGFDKISKV